jgi:hypothetical protein
MARRVLILAGVIMLAAGFSAAASETGETGKLPLSFVLGSIGTSDLLSGMVPTYLSAGVKYKGLHFIEGRATSLQLLAGGVRTSGILWTDENGEPLEAYPQSGTEFDHLRFAYWRGDVKMRLQQELLPDTAAYIEWGLTAALPVENSGGSSSLILDEGTLAAYPDRNGFAANLLTLGAVYSTVSGTHMKQGVSAELYFRAAPEFLLNTVFGTTDFYQVHSTLKGFLPLARLSTEGSDEPLLAVYAADRLQVDYLIGSAVPQIFQEHPSLGKKMRGFESPSIGVNFTAVNNAEIRVSGPQLSLFGVRFGYPRFHLFLDTGAAAGTYYNSSAADSRFAASAGAEAAVNLFNFVDVGYRAGWILAGETIAGESVFGEMLIFLHWQ